MDHKLAVTRAAEIATRVLAPAATKNDREGRFPSEAVAVLGESGLLGLLVSKSHGGWGLGARALCDVTAALAEADASAAMIFLMHACATACISAAPETPLTKVTLEAIARGKHLSTLALSEV